MIENDVSCDFKLLITSKKTVHILDLSANYTLNYVTLGLTSRKINVVKQ